MKKNLFIRFFAVSFVLLVSSYLSANSAKKDSLESNIKHLRLKCLDEPYNILLLSELANSLTLRGYFDEAIDLNKKILMLDPNHANAAYNLAFTLKRKGNFQRSINAFKSLINQHPNHKNAQFALGTTLLYKGDFQEGWRQHDIFLRSTKRYSPHLKEWIREKNLTGKRILIRHEGGLGDSLQFIRYAQELKKLGATTIVACPYPLLKLYERCNGIDILVESNNYDNLKKLAINAQTTVMTLPALFDATEDTIPQTIPYIFPDRELSTFWKSILEKDKQFKIGICWKTAYNNPPNVDISSRSIPFDIIAQLATAPGVSLYSLQKDSRAKDYKKTPLSSRIIFFDNDFDETNGRFMDTAAVIKHLDLIISADTSIVHLAGAQGKPVWLMLNYSPADWRWIYGRTDSPWYPSLRIFQQTKPFDWNSVINEIINSLKKIK